MSEDANRAQARWPRSVYSVGEEPDVRFTLANERTLLAWLRTSLATIAAVTAIVVLLHDMNFAMHVVLAVTALAGTVAAPLAFRRWALIERALRLERPLPSPVLVLIYISALVVLGTVVALVVVTG